MCVSSEANVVNRCECDAGLTSATRPGGLLEEYHHPVDVDHSPRLQLAQSDIRVLWNLGHPGNLRRSSTALKHEKQK